MTPARTDELLRLADRYEEYGTGALFTRAEIKIMVEALRAHRSGVGEPVETSQLALALEVVEMLASLGGNLTQADIGAGLLHRTAFYDCPHDLVIYTDGMGKSITVGDVRRARAVRGVLLAARSETGHGWEEVQSEKAKRITGAVLATIKIGGDNLAIYQAVLGALPVAQASGNSGVIEFEYCNWEGRKAIRQARPISIRFGKSEWHPKPQWLLLAFDIDKEAEREFAMADMAFDEEDVPPALAVASAEHK